MEKAVVLKKLIEDKGVSMREFSRQADIPYTTLRSILERGVGKAAIDNVLKICKALGVTAEQLESLANGEVIDSRDSEEIKTLAAHHDSENWTEEELKELEDFKRYVLSKRQN